MRKWIVIFGLIAVALGFWGTKMVLADEDCLENPSGWPLLKIQTCAAQLENLYNLSVAATTPLESQIKDLDKRTKSLQASIDSAVKKQKSLEANIGDREQKMAEHYVILAKKTEELYKKLRQRSVLTEILSKVGSGINREIGYQNIASDFDRQLIIGFSNEILTLETDKKNLEDQKAKLAILQESLNKQANFFKGEVAKAKAYQSNLSGQISSLQAAILAAKSGSFITSVGDSELADDYNASIKGFRESAPAGSFSVFSFGAYTHRKGMSQYGARGRANSGKSYDEILRAYYDLDGYEDRGGITIRVNNGNGVNLGSVIWSGSLEEYVKRIYEVPSSWPAASLQSQAIAARSYVLAVTNNGTGSICANQYCQVFKTSPKGGDWESAVNATSGKVMISGGQPVKAFYSSTAGAFSFSKGWDTTDGNGGGNFFDKSYEKIGGSPWAYKAWYRQGYTSSGSTCGKGDPWLTNEQFTDLINAAIVLKNGSDDRVTPVDNTCLGKGNPYSYADLRSKGGVSSVSSVVVTQGNGETNEVVINGSIHLTGREFKKGYNLRAPGYLRIPQGLGFGSLVDFEFFNIEKK